MVALRSGKNEEVLERRNGGLHPKIYQVLEGFDGVNPVEAVAVTWLFLLRFAQVSEPDPPLTLEPFLLHINYTVEIMPLHQITNTYFKE